MIKKMKTFELELFINSNFYNGNSGINESVAKDILSLITGIDKNRFIKTDKNNSKEKKYPDWFCQDNNEYYEITISDNPELIKFLKKNSKYELNFTEEELIKNIYNAFIKKNNKEYVSNIHKNLFIFSSIFIPTFLIDSQFFNEEKILLTYFENCKKVKVKQLNNNSLRFPNVYSFCKKLQGKIFSNNKFKSIFICMFIPNGMILLIDLNNMENSDFIKIFLF